MTISQLHAYFLESSGVCTDTRKITKDCIFFALKGDNFNGNQYAAEAVQKGAKYAVIDEKEYLLGDKTLMVDHVLKTLQELATHHRRYCNAKIIGLTGSNGKTTTKELIHRVLSKKYNTVATKGNLNNHIGVPLTLLSIQKDTEIAIVEMGANHQKEIEFLCTIAQPDYGYITNFGKAHLEGFGGPEGVIAGKSELYAHLMDYKKSIFLNADDPIQEEKLSSYTKKYGFSARNSNYFQIQFKEANPFVSLEVEGLQIQSQLIGAYNFTNCAAAIIMGKYFNVPLQDIKTAIEAYVPQNNRSQIISKSGHRIILDAYNANPTSMEAALRNFKALDGEPKVLFLGDMFELGETAAKEHQYIADMALQMDFEEVFLIGENFNAIHTSLQQFNTFELLATFLKEKKWKNSHILIKGSRGMALERILDLL
ncbi:UDP-N-acetylmuramoyl-tripeptide--D-alanyl-D-alanine ligase [Spongiimicrobium salis]|uniref:UDP-N-acetylmuramoyl-tripeptide--D-alanyl-D- alanine ligase n=1 Tax=Spongiimicrobium salis TaxID=1667022 RepID=UPI00374D9DA5